MIDQDEEMVPDLGIFHSIIFMCTTQTPEQEEWDFSGLAGREVGGMAAVWVGGGAPEEEEEGGKGEDRRTRTGGVLEVKGRRLRGMEAINC